jgi:hypothetical protein
MSERFDYAPGRVKFEQVKIIKKDLSTDVTNLTVEANIFSSILDPICTCKFLIIDAKNILSNLPIEVGDRVELTIGYPDVQKTFVFFIVGIENIADDQKQRSYVLKGVSELGFVSPYRNISKYYKGTTSEIAYSVFKDNTSEKHAIWEPSIGLQNIVVPNWNPIKTLHWLAKRSTSAVDNTRFYFWQGSDMMYNFAPIERFRDIYKNKPPQKFTYGRNNQMIGNEGAQKPNSEAGTNTILSISYQDCFDIQKQIKSGKTGGVRYQTDVTTKTLNITTYNYWDSFNKDSSLNGNVSWPRNNEMSKGKVQFDSVARHNYDNVVLNKVNDTSNLKMTSLDNSQYIDITIHGNQVTEVGQVVEIEILSPEPFSENIRDKFDLRWSGKYYIVAKRDLFNREEHRIALTLAKESMTTRDTIL